MLIDWFTVAAQVINFLILVWLLKRFLYQPILSAIDAREKRIAAELADAADKQAAAKTEQDTFQRKNQKFEQQRDKLMQQAINAAAAEEKRLLEKAHQAATAVRDKQQQALANDVNNLMNVLSRKAGQEVFAIARKALSDLASTSLEERMVEIFIRRLGELDVASKSALAQAIKTSAVPALLRSAFDLPETQRTAIQHALNETFSADIELQFKTAEPLVSGIELSAKGQKLAWSIADYLVSLEECINALLKQQSHVKSDVEHTPATLEETPQSEENAESADAAPLAETEKS